MRSINDIYIAVMGMTGAGKTSFVSACMEKEPSQSHHGLLSSELYRYKSFKDHVDNDTTCQALQASLCIP